MLLFSSADFFKINFFSKISFNNSISMPNDLHPDQGRHSAGPIGAVCSGSTLFASILDSSEMLGSYLQQTTSADDSFRCISH